MPIFKFLSTLWGGKQASSDIVIHNVSQNWGATIVVAQCQDQKYYDRLPSFIMCQGIKCYKCAFHPDTHRAYYRSPIESIIIAPEPTETDLMNMDRQQLIDQGYLVIQKRRNLTSFVPTDKWRQGMKLDYNSELTTIHTQQGIKTFNHQEVKGILAQYTEGS
jgi:hypothetical protein